MEKERTIQEVIDDLNMMDNYEASYYLYSLRRENIRLKKENTRLRNKLNIVR